jgi:hypothetical protein
VNAPFRGSRVGVPKERISCCEHRDISDDLLERHVVIGLRHEVQIDLPWPLLPETVDFCAGAVARKTIEGDGKKGAVVHKWGSPLALAVSQRRSLHLLQQNILMRMNSSSMKAPALPFLCGSKYSCRGTVGSKLVDNIIRSVAWNVS